MYKRMDYIYTNSNQEILIESIQNDTRIAIIQKYIDCRKEQGITQEELARRSGVSRPNIARFESGRYNPSLEMLVKIAMALNMVLDFNLKEIE